ncbi:hypothetical protein NC652_018646 [Populus alba x Populus x berolinensis]|uniref:Uncharacterized protein n=1 Tax=Populus alba x Populus x berolinensis TaxID=444605 RepID=A0AAD6QGP6_9ROSI|nr:hypothetical protein NC652_018646 [Populus alba x Populus x berolinensis]KAJ6990024.1 hypothetical protein NC653_018520 [Populus alba x Populus x berolinensis]
MKNFRPKGYLALHAGNSTKPPDCSSQDFRIPENINDRIRSNQEMNHNMYSNIRTITKQNKDVYFLQYSIIRLLRQSMIINILLQACTFMTS